MTNRRGEDHKAPFCLVTHRDEGREKGGTGHLVMQERHEVIMVFTWDGGGIYDEQAPTQSREEKGAVGRSIQMVACAGLAGDVRLRKLARGQRGRGQSVLDAVRSQNWVMARDRACDPEA